MTGISPLKPSISAVGYRVYHLYEDSKGYLEHKDTEVYKRELVAYMTESEKSEIVSVTKYMLSRLLDVSTYKTKMITEDELRIIGFPQWRIDGILAEMNRL